MSAKVVVERLSSNEDLDGVLAIELASFINPTTRGWYERELERPDVCFIYVLRTPECRVAAYCAFWLVVEPPWRIDRAPLTASTALPGALDVVEVPVWAVVVVVIAFGTLAPYALNLAALRRLPAATVGAVGMLEPVVATVVAWGWLGQSLTEPQVLGGAVVLAGVALAQAVTSTSTSTSTTASGAVAVEAR